VLHSSAILKIKKAGISADRGHAREHIVTMVKSVSNTKGHFGPKSFDEGKTEDSFRTLGLDDEVRIAINEYIDSNKLVSHSVDKFTYLFQDSKGNYLNPDTLSDAYRAMARRMKIKGDKGFKNLRHHHGSVLQLAKVPLEIIKNRLGHSLTSTTEKYYLKDLSDKTINDGLGDVYLNATKKKS